MPHRLPAFARLLPKTIRLRVFEPAYNDMLSSLASGGRGSPGSLRVLLRAGVLALESARVGLPRLAWRSLRTSRRVQVAIAVILLALIGLLIQASLGSDVPQRY